MLKWPDLATVEQALRRWVDELVRQRSDVVGIGAFGSFARGDWGVGSDLDLLIIVADSDKPAGFRGCEFDATRLPVPADVLVYTEAEWEAMRREGRRFYRTVEREGRWLYPNAGTTSPPKTPPASSTPRP